ncbi:NAD(P)-binding protein [Cryphonectria parasitica EP155]|uniref:NAD(P)-binding protein n=1 Tax=Cryphonectria parasitica (strain ATCC 38755 / EP155) TaxID=660469 RepID=A0A9P5CIJ7_CRYP1|nr:NAD(P)-binding protein [Cryphonectria parasitica EP155]KAF3760578.1 NAD(P)-binding protein [Cryphonectria parasitica EP155]
MASSSSSRVALIFGTGSNVGAALVKGFLGAGYHVATVSRSKPASTPTNVHAIQADLSDPKAVPKVFQQLTSAGLAFPSVVIWNAAAVSPPSDPENPLEVDEDAFSRDFDLMVKSPYVAAREAVRVWKEGEETGRKGTFIVTGNFLPKKILPVPALVGLGIGKSGANYWVGLADVAFKAKGIRFFFADERTAEGGPVGSKPDGEGHFKIFSQLLEDDELPYYVTFVNGKYQEFS